MNERESGWYRVRIDEFDYWDVLYFDGVKWWYGESTFSETSVSDCSFDVHEMVMNNDGKIVYNQPTERAKAAVERYNNPDSWNVNEHDPLYNTK